MKKIRLFILLIFLLPILISAQTMDIPKPSRPSRYTVPQTQPIASTLPDIEEEAARAASIASSFAVDYTNPLSPGNALLPDLPVLPIALGPTLEESIAFQNMAALTSIINPPQFLMATSPSITSLISSDELVRMAHSGGDLRAADASIYGPSFFGSNILPPLGPGIGQGLMPAPFPGPGWYQPNRIPPYGGAFSGQIIMPDPFLPLPPPQMQPFWGPGWYPPEAIITPIPPNLYQGIPMNILPPLAASYSSPFIPTPFLFHPQPNFFPNPLFMPII